CHPIEPDLVRELELVERRLQRPHRELGGVGPGRNRPGALRRGPEVGDGAEDGGLHGVPVSIRLPGRRASASARPACRHNPGAMEKIDVFCHVMPRAYADKLEAHASSAEAANLRMRSTGVPAMVDLGLRFRQMEEFGDDYRQVVSLPAPSVEDL